MRLPLIFLNWSVSFYLIWIFFAIKNNLIFQSKITDSIEILCTVDEREKKEISFLILRCQLFSWKLPLFRLGINEDIRVVLMSLCATSHSWDVYVLYQERILNLLNVSTE